MELEGNELPIYDIKDYESRIRNDLDTSREILYVMDRMRKSYDFELGDTKNYIYNENESNYLKLNDNQINYLKKLAEDLNLHYDYHKEKGIHFIYKFDLFFGNLFN